MAWLEFPYPGKAFVVQTPGPEEINSKEQVCEAQGFK